eukprot:scaffold5204_cov296-Pinguiococcus_pyrenoidosus.AAC.1
MVFVYNLRSGASPNLAYVWKGSASNRVRSSSRPPLQRHAKGAKGVLTDKMRTAVSPCKN